MKLKELKEKVSTVKIERDVLLRQIESSKQDQETILNTMEDLEEARIILQKASQITQKQISFHIENIVTHALSAVFDDPYEFKVDFVTRRNVTECDLFFVNDSGTEMKPLDSCGYGAADIASLALRVAYWKLSKDTRNTMLLDEPTRNLSLDKQPLASIMIKELSEKLKLQFLIVTHNKALADEAETIFKVSKHNEISSIKEV